jgi:hypothetical protein
LIFQVEKIDFVDSVIKSLQGLGFPGLRGATEAGGSRSSF